MDLKTYRAYLKKMDRDKLEEALIELYKRESKPDKELVVLTVTAVNENLTIPDRKAVIPNTAAIEKQLDRFMNLDGSILWRKKTWTRLKRHIRQIIKDLTACPVRSEVHDEAVRLLRRTFAYCIYLNDHFSSSGISIEYLTGMSADDFYRMVLQAILAAGYTRANLLEAARFTIILNMYDLDDVIPYMEIFVQFLKNGDLRQELMEILEHEFEKKDLNNKKSQRYWLRLAMIYFMLCEKEADVQYGIDFLAGLDKDFSELASYCWLHSPHF